MFENHVLPCGPKDIADLIKTIVETFAYLLAGLFFIYKWLAGYLTTNLSLRVKCQRARDEVDNTKDVLAIMLVLSKGDRGSLKIHDIEVRVNGQTVPELAKLREQLWRFSNISPTKQIPYRQIKWGQRSSRSPSISLTPGEETQLASYCKVEHATVCRVEAVILGNRKHSRYLGEWRASAVSFPAGAKASAALPEI